MRLILPDFHCSLLPTLLSSIYVIMVCAWKNRRTEKGLTATGLMQRHAKRKAAPCRRKKHGWDKPFVMPAFYVASPLLNFVERSKGEFVYDLEQRIRDHEQKTTYAPADKTPAGPGEESL